MVDVKAPGAVTLFGEYAAEYGRLLLCAAIQKYATVSVAARRDANLKVMLPDFSEFSMILDRRRLSHMRRQYKNRKNIEEYARLNKDIDPRMLPYATIAARLAGEFEAEIFGKEVNIRSEIPIRKGCSGSAACYTAFTVAMLSAASMPLGDGVVIDIARDGERVANLSEDAGAVEVAASYYGGYASSAKGGKAELLGVRPSIVLVDTGERESEEETAGNVRRLYQQRREEVEGIFAGIGECAQGGLAALEDKDLAAFGRYMYRDHELLRELGVSSEGLDRAVGIARENGAYGAKLTGRGRGGMAVAACKDHEMMVRAMEENGFAACATAISREGAGRQMP